MELILLRHAKAEAINTIDAARNLTDEGIAQARKAGEYLKKINCLPELVLTSPLARARQTADTFCSAASLPGAVMQAWLSSGMHPDTALRELCGFSEFKRICIVGHEPDFSTLIAWITHADAGSIEIKKASLTMIELSPPSRSGVVKFCIPPKMLI